MTMILGHTQRAISQAILDFVKLTTLTITGSHACNPSIWEGKTGESGIEGQDWLQEILFGKEPNQNPSIASLTLTGSPPALSYAVEFTEFGFTSDLKDVGF